MTFLKSFLRSLTIGTGLAVLLFLPFIVVLGISYIIMALMALISDLYKMRNKGNGQRQYTCGSSEYILPKK